MGQKATKRLLRDDPLFAYEFMTNSPAIIEFKKALLRRAKAIADSPMLEYEKDCRIKSIEDIVIAIDDMPPFNVPATPRDNMFKSVQRVDAIGGEGCKISLPNTPKNNP